MSNFIQERERREQDQAARDKFDADKKKIQDEKEAVQAAYILARMEEKLAQLRRDKALNLGPEPEGGADVTHVCLPLYFIIISLRNLSHAMFEMHGACQIICSLFPASTF